MTTARPRPMGENLDKKMAEADAEDKNAKAAYDNTMADPKEAPEAEAEEKIAKAVYDHTMAEPSDTRTQESKPLTDKEAAEKNEITAARKKEAADLEARSSEWDDLPEWLQSEIESRAAEQQQHCSTEQQHSRRTAAESKA